MKLALLLLFVSLSALAKGNLLLIGGGNRSQEILREMVKLANGNILIVPLASSIPADVAASAKAQLLAVGAESVSVFSCSVQDVDRDPCQKEIRKANLIYFTGGSQNQLYDAFKNSKALKLMRLLHRKTLHLAGTSAGTAVMSEIMITGRPLSPYTQLQGVRAQMIETTEGFGFVKSFILDQHFLKRSRQDRLLSAVLDSDVRVGVGIDESTAILIRDDESFRVIGDSQVMVMDARKAKVSVEADGTYLSEGVVTRMLAPGSSFRLP